MIKQLSCLQETTPSFFEALHNTTIDMRMKLLQDLAKSESLRRELEAQYREGQIKIIERDQRIRQLENKLKNTQNSPKSDLVNNLQMQIDDLKK